jgi:hypothetical protein
MLTDKIKDKQSALMLNGYVIVFIRAFSGHFGHSSRHIIYLHSKA